MPQVVLVTGASSGIGKETAKLLLLSGFTVYAAARRVEKMKDLEGAGAKVIKLDISKEDSVKDCIATIVEKEGQIDVLVNNAGYGNAGAVENVSIEEARQQYEVNVFGLARITQLVLPVMRKQKSGKIINISSIGGKMTLPFFGWYNSTKHAVESLSDALRLELYGSGIQVVVVEPGAIKTEFGDVARSTYEENITPPYKEMAKNLQKAMEGRGNSGSEPIVIAKVIQKAIYAKNPKTRYVAGAMAKPMLFMKKMLSDKKMDKQLYKMLLK